MHQIIISLRNDTFFFAFNDWLIRLHVNVFYCRAAFLELELNPCFYTVSQLLFAYDHYRLHLVW